ncbi:hypothetical protein BCR35DRAFT_328891 [Leucosporidium creatinivorum]|uniref:FAD-binding FR-type domain-containing protein n=1 Tax=Leucosporidium creatinivorum TaxID=106004 RepID=A0A1Y2G104_9BASI|nr:hypothetical protein BCR35DRAFT_328891 [Leucosporidium creatinivorum]
MSSLNQLVRRHDHHGLKTSELDEMLLDPPEQAPKYARAAVYFISAVILVAGLGQLLGALRRRSSFHRRQLAALRYIGYSQPRALGFVKLPTLGSMLLIASFTLFIGIWTLAQQPYYYSSWPIGSPPLAIRSGFFALGLFPFILALGARWNLISFLTGHSHEQLQVFRRWLSHMFFVLSLLHALPFCIAGSATRTNDDGFNPNGYSEIYYSWHVSGMLYYWSGIAALVTLAWVCWAPLTPLRKHFAFLSDVLHYVSGILFLGFFYVHCNNISNTWQYFYATFAIYGFSLLARLTFLLIRNGRQIPRASIEPLADNALRVSIKCSHTWKAGQHVMVNFINAAPFESRSFSIANAPSEDGKATANPISLIITSSPHSTIYPRLRALASSGSSTPVLIDGSYGGLSHNTDFAQHQIVLLFAEGVGASFVVALLEDLCRRMKASGHGVQIEKVELHWAVEHEEVKSWFDEQIAEAVSLVTEGAVELHLYVTGTSVLTEQPQVLEKESPDADSELEKNSCFASGTSALSLKSLPSAPWALHDGTLSLGPLITDKLARAAAGSSVGVASCGSHDFNVEVRRAVAARQLLIVKGRGGEGAEEVELHCEEVRR